MSLRTVDHRKIQQKQFSEPLAYAGYKVHDPLGHKIGVVEEIFANSADEPEYVKVRMGFFGLRSALIPVQLVAVDTQQRVLLLQ